MAHGEASEQLMLTLPLDGLGSETAPGMMRTIWGQIGGRRPVRLAQARILVRQLAEAGREPR